MNENKQRRLNQWWHSPLGEMLIQHEQDILTSLNHPLVGYFYVQLGGHYSLFPPSNRAIKTSIVGPTGDLNASAESLPFKSHSIDNLLLLHVLEYAHDPHQVLRETERVLGADGRVILCSFNPWSLWGLRRLFSWQDNAPWHGHFFTQIRIRDWLALLNFEVVEHHKVMFRPPFSRMSWLNRCRFLERWGKRLWPCFGGVTIVVACKRTIPLNPLKQRWRQPNLFPSAGLVNKPITREGTDGPR